MKNATVLARRRGAVSEHGVLPTGSTQKMFADHLLTLTWDHMVSSNRQYL